MIHSDEPSNTPPLFVDEDGEKVCFHSLQTGAINSPPPPCQELLRAFMRARSRTELPQGLILDSTVPELAPHIVISPPSDQPFESYCSCGSCDRDWPYIPQQHSDALVVPIQQWGHSANEGLDVPCDPLESPPEYVQYNDATQSNAGVSDIEEASYRVFSHSWFRYSVRLSLTGLLGWPAYLGFAGRGCRPGASCLLPRRPLDPQAVLQIGCEYACSTRVHPH